MINAFGGLQFVSIDEVLACKPPQCPFILRGKEYSTLVKEG